MRVVQVLDETIAERLRTAGWKEIRTQFYIEQLVWTFLYEESRPACFDIDSAIKRGVCRVSDHFTMAF